MSGTSGKTENKQSLLSLENVLSATGGVHVLGDGEFFFDSVQTDSRLVTKNSLFVPLIGENQDGHKFIPQAVAAGVSVVFIAFDNFEKDSDYFVDIHSKNPAVIFIAVQNTLTALQKTAAAYVDKFPSLIKIGVTGSSGKTTTKEIAAAILSQKYSVVTNRGNFNSETGLPLSVFAIRKEHQIGIFEMGMNRVNEIGEIASVLKPRFAVITNIGTAHIGILGSRENIAAEKSKIFDYFQGIGTAFIPAGDDFASFLKERVDGNVVLYGEGVDADVQLVKDKGLEGTEISVCGKKALIPLPGKYNFLDALAAVELAKFMGLSAEEICSGLNNLKPMFGRSQVLHGRYTVVQDCYNANPDSMERAIEFISSVPCPQGKCLVLGDMLELGEASASEHRKTGLLAAGAGCSLVVFTGDEMQNAYNAALESHCKCELAYFAGKSDSVMEQAAEKVCSSMGEGAVVLVKGSRGMGLERAVAHILGENSHD